MIEYWLKGRGRVYCYGHLGDGNSHLNVTTDGEDEELKKEFVYQYISLYLLSSFSDWVPSYTIGLSHMVDRSLLNMESVNWRETIDHSVCHYPIHPFLYTYFLSSHFSFTTPHFSFFAQVNQPRSLLSFDLSRAFSTPIQSFVHTRWFQPKINQFPSSCSHISCRANELR